MLICVEESYCDEMQRDIEYVMDYLPQGDEEDGFMRDMPQEDEDDAVTF
jgi:putative membrane protein